MRIWLLPIEPLEERYSAQWYRWWPQELRALGHEVVVIDGGQRPEGHKIETGQFLDVYDTNVYKGLQIVRMAQHLREGHVKESDWVLLLDGWSPAVTALAYMRDAGNVRFKLGGLLHAGTWDPQDFLFQKNLTPWAQHVEQGWLEAMDAIFVATNFHRMLLAGNRYVNPDRLHVTGFPYLDELQQFSKPWRDRPRLVVFPHRIAPEKQPEVFEHVQRVYELMYPGDDVSWFMTKDACATKDDYFTLLGSARVSFSSALQETWGIAMIESALLGAHCVVPNRLSYLDTMPHHSRYNSLEHAARLIRAGLDAIIPMPYTEQAGRWAAAIPNICARMLAWAP